MLKEMESIAWVPLAPAIPGLSFRNFRGEEDCAVILAILQDITRADGLKRTDTLEQVRHTYTHLTHCDPAQDLLFAEIHGQPVGYCRVEWRIEQPDTLILWSIGFLCEQWRRKGLGRAMLDWAERRLRVVTAGQLHAQCLFELFAEDKEIGKHALAQAAGYHVERQFYTMVRPDLENIPDLPLPEGVELRPVTPADYRKVWDAMQEAFRDHWGYCEPEEKDYQAWLEDPQFQTDLWQVAWQGDEVVGMVLGYIDEEANRQFGQRRGWTEEISVRRPWRGRGVARALIASCLRALKRRGMSEAALGVDTQNLSGALRLYEQMGYRPISCNTTYRKTA